MKRNPNEPRVRRGIFYFPSYEQARWVATQYGWPTDRIIRYELGWAIQKRVSGPYYGPDDIPAPKEAR